MPAYNYKPQFADKVEQLIKRQTIRPKRKRPTRPSDTLYHYTGMRTKACRKLLEAKCQDVQPIDFGRDGEVWVDGQQLTHRQITELAEADGFDSTIEFWRFFEQQYGLPLIGVMEVIKW